MFGNFFNKPIMNPRSEGNIPSNTLIGVMKITNPDGSIREERNVHTGDYLELRFEDGAKFTITPSTNIFDRAV